MDIASINNPQELADLRTQIEIREREILAADRHRVRQQIIEAALTAGYEVDQLFGFGKHKAGKVAKKVAVKYRHPHNPKLVWTGRGHTAVWVREWIANGGTRDELRVS